MDLSGIELREAIEPARIEQLVDLYGATWWAADRTDRDVARMLAGSDVIIALVDRGADRLVGFARVLTDAVYMAVVLDVVVAPDRRASGLGRMLLDAIVGHPDLATVQSVELVCQPDLVDFYRQWGFTDDVGRSALMRRTSHGVLASTDP